MLFNNQNVIVSSYADLEGGRGVFKDPLLTGTLGDGLACKAMFWTWVSGESFRVKETREWLK
ncbi:MAG: hypothetical protein Q3993_05625 [Filifactor alocis]|nr:hypothetical protein [Filifactor alocis]